MATTQTIIATLADFGEKSAITVTSDLGKLTLFRVDGEVFATEARCPHAKGPLVAAEICDKTITCAWHGWTFDLVTGGTDADPTMFVKTYPVHLDGVDIVLSA